MAGVCYPVPAGLLVCSIPGRGARVVVGVLPLDVGGGGCSRVVGCSLVPVGGGWFGAVPVWGGWIAAGGCVPVFRLGLLAVVGCWCGSRFLLVVGTLRRVARCSRAGVILPVGGWWLVVGCWLLPRWLACSLPAWLLLDCSRDGSGWLFLARGCSPVGGWHSPRRVVGSARFRCGVVGSPGSPVGLIAGVRVILVWLLVGGWW